jgi:hypothetical protein
MADARYDPAVAEMWRNEPFVKLFEGICELGQSYAISTGKQLREVVLTPFAGVLDGDVHHVATPSGIVAVRFSSR